MPTFHAQATRDWLGMLAALTGLCATAAISNFLLDRPGLEGTQVPPKSVAAEVALFGLNSLVIFCVVAIVFGLVGRLWLTAAVIVSTSWVVAFASQMKLTFRFEPLYPTDVKFVANPGFLIAMIDGRALATLMIVCLLITTVCLISRRVSQRRAEVSPAQRRFAVGFRLLLVAASVPVLGIATQLADPQSRARAVYGAAGAEWVGWRQNANYEANGFVAGFLYNLGASHMARPANYSAQTMESVVKRHTGFVTGPAASQQGTTDARPNIVLVLSESFIDPEHMPTPQFAVDPIPFTRELMASTTSGVTLASNYGGGTANMEFSALTGFSLRLFTPQTSIPYQQVISSQSSFPSVVGYMRSKGYHTTALHPYEPTMYQRNEVYRALGFHEFLTLEDFPSAPPGQFVSDTAVFDRTLAEIDRREAPLFANVVTIQNHGPYENRYTDPIPAEGELTSLERSRVENHARGLRHSDSALEDFLQALARRTEETVVLYYGDHHPGYLSARTYRSLPPRPMHEPPFILWTSEGLPKRDDLPTLSPMYFMNLVFEAADLEKPPYYSLLASLQEALPGINPDMLIGPDNRELEVSDLSDRTRRLLRDYRLVQYDLVMGEQYSLDTLLYKQTEPNRFRDAG